MFSEIHTSSHPCWFSYCLDDGHSINNGNLTSYTIGLNSHKLTLNCTGPHRAIKCEERSWKQQTQIRQCNSCRFSSGRASITTRKRANSLRLSFMATSLSLVHLLTFRVLFHMRSLTFLIGLQMLISLSTSLSWTNLSNISCPIEFRWKMAFFTGSGMTALVIMFMTTSSATVKGSFTMRMSRSLLTFCSYRCSTSWWQVLFYGYNSCKCLCYIWQTAQLRCYQEPSGHGNWLLCKSF